MGPTEAKPEGRVVKEYISSLSKEMNKFSSEELQQAIAVLQTKSGPSPDTRRKLIKQAKALLKNRHGIWVS